MRCCARSWRTDLLVDEHERDGRRDVANGIAHGRHGCRMRAVGGMRQRRQCSICASVLVLQRDSPPRHGRRPAAPRRPGGRHVGLDDPGGSPGRAVHARGWWIRGAERPHADGYARRGRGHLLVLGHVQRGAEAQPRPRRAHVRVRGSRLSQCPCDSVQRALYAAHPNGKASSLPSLLSDIGRGCQLHARRCRAAFRQNADFIFLIRCSWRHLLARCHDRSKPTFEWLHSGVGGAGRHAHGRRRVGDSAARQVARK